MVQLADTTVILVNWNGVKLLPKALDSLKSQSYKRFTILVIDNDSHDDSLKMLASNYPSVRVIEAGKNHGYAGGVNRAVATITTPYFALLNTDATADPTWLEILIEQIKADKQLAVATAQSLLGKTNQLDAAGDMMSLWGVAYPRGRHQPAETVWSSEVFSGTGGYSLYRRDVWLELGGFDDDFFMYYEDVDYCYRAHLYGYGVAYVPAARVRHSLGVSSQKRGKNFTRRLVIRNAQYVFWKNTPWPIVVRTLWRFLIVNLYMTMAAIRAGAWLELGQAYEESLLAIPRTLHKRRLIQRQAKTAWRVIYSRLSTEWPFRKGSS